MTGGEVAGRPAVPVVVESPAKARTIRKALGRGYRVIACHGHPRDLEAREGSVRPGEDFAMVYAEPRGRALRALRTILATLVRADALILATDPDREGEAIAWQVLSWLRKRDAIGTRSVRRVDFREITPDAVRAAMAQPRELDMDLVHAQQARRALDYLVGYGISPLLWRKVPGCRSAGRVQSAALRLVCEREAEIEAFAPQAYWTLEAELATSNGERFTARPIRLDGAPLGAFPFATRAVAESCAGRIRATSFTVASIERRVVRRKPAPPLTTAAMQREAARKLGFGIGHTMALAQALYEGVDLDGEITGLITYMRTDSVALSRSAVREARHLIGGMFGKGYLPAKPRVFSSRARRSPEAHEAIRPTVAARTPETLAGRVDGDAVRLYALIRDRVLASQMAAARLDRVEVELTSAQGDISLAVSRTATMFDGFLRVWRGTAGGPPAAGEGPLSAGEAGAAVTVHAVRIRRHETAPPPRYTESGLVRRLEELGIGRPSTYAVMLDVLRDRRYVAHRRGRFAPLERGRVAAAFVASFFGPWTEYGFTSGLETDLDRIAAGALSWKGLLRGFWSGFHSALEEVGALRRSAVLAAIETALADFIHGPGSEATRRRCPSCAQGTLRLKRGRGGLFVGCSSWPACGYRRPLQAVVGEDGAGNGPKSLGSDPVTGLPVTVRSGPHGRYVQRGDGAGGAGLARVSVPRGITPDEVTLDVALALLALPREVGVHPATGETILAGIGRYGPWLRHADTYASIADGDDVLHIGINRAVSVLAEKEIRRSRSRGPNRVLRELGSHPTDGAPVRLKTGHYGPFVAHRRSYASLSSDVSPDTLTLEQALDLLRRAGASPGRTARHGRRGTGV